ncbi:MAG: hypothetical protein ACOYEH_08050 [Caldicoprobacterales bacterium]|jgi:hypothetical protein|nr:hypothetical protein [Clostridiales bacterium]
MIQIDDSGSGSLIGGTCIGAIRVESGDYVYDFIPTEYYRDNLFRKKKYLIKAEQIVLSLLKKLDWKSGEIIEICQGYMFDQVRKVLDTKKAIFYCTRIEEPLQSRIERTFQDYALSLGLLPQYVKYTKYPLHFHRILRWVYADYENRMSLCKTGWKSWKKYGNLDIKVEEDVLYKSNYICLKCGKGIKKAEKVKRLEYYSNCHNIIYLHRRC